MRATALALLLLLSACAPPPAQPTAAQVTLPPLPSLPTVEVVDDGDGWLNQQDIDIALGICGEGCNLYFPAGNYWDVVISLNNRPLGVGIYGDGEASTFLFSPIFDYPRRPFRPLIQVGIAPMGQVIVEGLTLDGRKTEQVPPLDQDGNLVTNLDGVGGAIGFNSWVPFAPRELKDGILRNLVVRNFLKSGITMGRASGWTIEDNVVHDIGCHQIDTTCGPMWDSVLDITYSNGVQLFHRKTPGLGIILVGDVTDTVIQRNHVSFSSKIGIEIFGRTCQAVGNTIVDNIAEHNGSGIVTNGGDLSYVARNHSTENGMTGLEMYSLGHGFACGSCNSGNVWEDNVASGNVGSGYNMACASANDITFTNNRSVGNCDGLVSGGVSVGFAGSVDSPPTNLVIEGFLADDYCAWGLSVARRGNVQIRDVDVKGGTFSGLWLRDVFDVEVSESTFRDHRDGVWFTKDTDQIDMLNVEVLPSVEFLNTERQLVMYTGSLASIVENEPTVGVR